MRAGVTGACLALALASIACGAEAATVTTTFNVTANVDVTCRMFATELRFGRYDENAFAPTDAQSNVLVDCTAGAEWEMALDRGLHGASVNARQMVNNTDPTVLLNYALFVDPARTINWGETPGTDTVTGTGTGLPQAVGVYGRVPALQHTATPGGYSDTITATLTF